MTSSANWDAICVGAGLTSLAFAAQVVHRHPGARILIIDRHSSPGGYATQFTRPKVEAYFDCSLHKISGTQVDGGNFHRLCEELDLYRDIDLVAHPDHFEACLPDGSLSLPNEVDTVEAMLRARFPDDSLGLQQLFRELRESGADAYYQHQILDGSYEVDFRRLRQAHRQLKGISLADALAARLQNGYLKEIVAAAAIYVGGFAEDIDYLYFLHVLYATLCKGNAYVVGSSQALSDALAARIVAAGGHIQLGTAVRKILPAAEGGLHAVETNRGRYYAPRIYINAAPHHAVRELFEPRPELAATQASLAALRPARATTTLYLLTDADPATLGLHSAETMILSSAQDDAIALRAAAAAAPEDAALNEQAYWQASTAEVTNYHILNPAGGRVVCVNVLDSVTHWPLRKSKDYKIKKARAEQALLQRLCTAKPDFSGHITYAELATPRTYQRYTQNTDGSGYGAVVAPQAGAHGFHHFFPYKGMHFLSSWVAGSGYEAAFVFAENKAKHWLAAGVDAPAPRLLPASTADS